MTDTTFADKNTVITHDWLNDVNDAVYDATKVSVTAPVVKTGTTLNGGITLSVSAASETASGVIELATAAEVTTGTDTTRAVTPAGAKVELDKKLVKANDLSDLASASSARTNLGLGTAATLDVGTTANLIVQLNASAQIPAVSGALLTNLPGSPVSSVSVTTGTTNLDATHHGKLILCDTSGGNITLTTTAAATLGDGWWCIVEKITTDANTVTIDPNASETWGETTTRVLSTYQDYSQGVCDGSNFHEVARASKIIQTVATGVSAVATGTTTLPVDDTIPQNTEGDQYMTQAITPKSAGSLLRIEVIANIQNNTSSLGAVAIFIDSVADALAVTALSVAGTGYSDAYVLDHTYQNTSIAAKTFKVRGGYIAAGTTTFNGSGGLRKFGGVYNSVIRVTELRP